MALVVKDRVRETTSSIGTGNIVLAGAVSGFQSFSVIGDGNTTYYTIVDAATGDWEVGIGTYTLGTTSLARDTILESSNAGSVVNFGVGTKDVFVTYPAERSLYVNNGVITPAVSATLPVSSGGTGITSFGTGVATFLGTPSSANLAAAVTDETGSGALVFASSPALAGVPTTPTAAAGTNTTQVASTAHVFAERTNTATLTNKTLTSPIISGGTINNAVIGGTTRAAGSFTTLDANGNVVLGDAATDTISTTGRFVTNMIPLADNLRDLGTSALKWKQVYATTYTEGTFPVVTQTDVGTAPNEIPLNQYLGNLAYQDAGSIAGDLQAGSINNTPIGATTASTGAFTTLSATDVTTVQAGTDALPALTPSGDPNTGIFFPAADQVGIATNGVERVEFGNSETVFNDGGGNVDFRIEGDTNANLFFADASVDAIGIGTSSPNASALLDVQSTTKGVRMPNMTTTQKNAIASPAAGLMVFDTTLSKLSVYSGVAWETVTSV